MKSTRARRGNQVSSKPNLPRYVQRGICPSGKRAHPDRASARRHVVDLRRVGTHVRAYQCPDCGFWHVGHLPRAVAVGSTTASEYYASRGQR